MIIKTKATKANKDSNSDRRTNEEEASPVALNINLSATLEQALRAKLAKNMEKEWKDENQKAIKIYNDFIEDNGLFADDYRPF